MLIHREALELARNCAPNEDGVPFTYTCVHITPDGAVTVTDGHHWLRMKAAADEPNLFDEIAEDGKADLEEDVMVPGEIVEAFSAAMKKRKVKKGMPVPHVVVAKQDQHVTLCSSDGTTKRTFLIDSVGKDLVFPNVDKTVLAHVAERHIILSVDLLSVIVRTLRSCKADSIRLGLPASPAAPITINAFCETGPITGALMPMRDAEAMDAHVRTAPAATQSKLEPDDAPLGGISISPDEAKRLKDALEGFQ